MRILLLSVGILLLNVAVSHGFEDSTLEDDDFAEFEQFEADDEVPLAKNDFDDAEFVEAQKLKPVSREQKLEAEDDILVEDEDSEFEHFQDPEEFEGFQDSAPRSSEQPKITITKVPIMVRGRWDAYWLEGILCCLLAAYALAYAVGRAKNTAIATNFLKLHKPLLNENFTLVGETGADVVLEGEQRGWRREAEHCFTMWCSGRTCCEGMLLTLKLIKRQDLVHVLLGCVRPTSDTLLIRAELAKDEADPFVLCVAQKKIASRLAKEMNDLSVYCGERRAGERHGLPSALSVVSECAEAAAGVLDARVAAALAKHHASLNYIHISDKYSGPKQMEESSSTSPPETERVLLVSVSLGADGGADELRPLLQLVLYLLDKIRRTRLSKEALAKCEKRRVLAAEAWQRGAHAQRQAQAAERRELRRQQEKERILAVRIMCIHKHTSHQKRRVLAAEAWQRGAHAQRQAQAAERRELRRQQEKERILAVRIMCIHKHTSHQKRRVLAAEAWQRGAHAQRQAQAAERRELRRQQEKERILAVRIMCIHKHTSHQKRRVLAAEAWQRGAHAQRQAQAAERRELRRQQEKERILAVRIMCIHKHTSHQKRRVLAAEAWQRGAHAQRQAQAAERRELRRQQEKERILAVRIMCIHKHTSHQKRRVLAAEAWQRGAHAQRQAQAAERRELRRQQEKERILAVRIMCIHKHTSHQKRRVLAAEAWQRGAHAQRQAQAAERRELRRQQEKERILAVRIMCIHKHTSHQKRRVLAAEAWQRGAHAQRQAQAAERRELRRQQEKERILAVRIMCIHKHTSHQKRRVLAAEAWQRGAHAQRQAQAAERRELRRQQEKERILAVRIMCIHKHTSHQKRRVLAAEAWQRGAHAQRQAQAAERRELRRQQEKERILAVRIMCIHKHTSHQKRRVLAAEAWQRGAHAQRQAQAAERRELRRQQEKERILAVRIMCIHKHTSHQKRRVLAAEAWQRGAHAQRQAQAAERRELRRQQEKERILAVRIMCIHKHTSHQKRRVLAAEAWQRGAHAQRQAQAAERRELRRQQEKERILAVRIMCIHKHTSHQKRRVLAAEAWQRGAHAQRQAQAAERRELRRQQEKERILAVRIMCIHKHTSHQKRRVLAAEAWQRGAHAQRQAQAAERRELRRQQEKERILAEDDPEKQRRWELKEQKRQQKRKTPKMKQLKVKAL